MIGRLASYPRAVLMVLLYIPFVVICSTLVIFLSFTNWQKPITAVIKFWSWSSLAMFGVSVKQFGKRPRGGCLYLFNHASFFDIFVMQAMIPRVRFGAKIELFKIPFFGKAMSRVGVLPIARQKREEVFRVYKEAEERAMKGQQFALSPEGTRQEIEVLGPFKAGPFVFAINAKIPVVPVVIKNAATILPKGAWLPNLGQWNRVVELHILEPIEVSHLKLEDRPKLQMQVREKMATLITLKENS